MPLAGWMEVLCKCFKSDQLGLDGRLPPRGKKREQELIKRLFGEDNVDLGNSGPFHDAVIRCGTRDVKIEFKEQGDTQWLDPSKYVGKYEEYLKKKSESEQETVIFVFACKKDSYLDLVYAVKENVLLEELFGGDKVLYNICKKMFEEKQMCKTENKLSKICDLQLKVPLKIRKLYEKLKNGHNKDFLVLFARNEVAGGDALCR